MRAGLNTITAKVTALAINFEHLIHTQVWMDSLQMAGLHTRPALLANGFPELQIVSERLRLRVAAPGTAKKTALQKNYGANTWTIVNSVPLNIEDPTLQNASSDRAMIES